MSRCFPYPPPGYTLSGARNEALIESIKSKEKERKEEKEKRKEKKEKRKKRKEQRKEKKEKANQNPVQSDVQLYLVSDDKFVIQKHDISQKSFPDKELVSLQKERESENDQSEQSSLTEEHARPATLSVPSPSSESTENSKKRKRCTPPEDACGCGKVLTTQLPSKKQNELDALVKEQQQQPCSTFGRIECPAITGLAKDWSENFRNGTRSDGHEPNTKNNGAILCPLQVEAGKIENKARPEPVLSSMQKTDFCYQNLFENLIPAQVQETWLCLDNVDWLLKCNRQGDQDKRAVKKLRSANDGLSCSRSSGLWPQVEFLLEADVYALPFTVPY